MRIAIGFLFLLSFGVTAQAQPPTGPYYVPIQVRTLTVASNDLPAVTQQNLVLAYQGQTCSLVELVERIRSGLRDMGYANASVEIPQLARMPEPSPEQHIDVTVQISAGNIYRLSEIRFERVSAFPTETLRKQIPLSDGDIFKVSAIVKGLEALKGLYTSQGFINFGAVPRPLYDENEHVLALIIEMDEGARYYFGRLSFSGIEPNKVTIEKLRAFWNSIQEKPYDFRLIENWLAANATSLPAAAEAPEKAAEKYVETQLDEEKHRIDVKLRLP